MATSISATNTNKARGSKAGKAKKGPFVIGEMNLATIEKNILLIRSKGKSLRKLIHETVAGILIHHVMHGDFTKLNDLRTALIEDVSSNVAGAMVTFVELHSNLRYGKDEKTGERKFYKLGGTPNALVFKDEKGSKVELTKTNWDESKLPSTITNRGFWINEPEWTAPAPVDFMERLESFLSAAKRMRDQSVIGVKPPKADDSVKPVKVEHKHINDDVLRDLAQFALAHGMDAGKVGKALGKEALEVTKH